MKIEEALKIRSDYFMNENPDEEDEFLYTEALNYLINETKDPLYMTELGWYYCERKRFDLEIKYLEMAAGCGDISALEELGYMYYYGQHGEKDYKKAYECFSKGAEQGYDTGSHWCRYKLADMYHYGYYVDKDEALYRKLIEELYKEIKDPMYLNEPFPEVALRLAEIRIEDGNTKEGVQLLIKAKDFLAERLREGAFWGHINVMERIIKDLYANGSFPETPDFYDLFHMTQRPGTVTFKYGMGRPKEFAIEVSDDDEHAIRFMGKWYRNFNELCNKAEIDGLRITAIYDELYDFQLKEAV
ncbi:MAG: hypothetical protein K6F34_03710 [Lachnospiraceae bacterium]|nr:hypothetical protein [Lachnospiraceae bacterium]